MEKRQSHYINGFVREGKFHEALRMGLQRNSNFKAKTIEPTFSKGLFEYRPCIRRLRYISSPDSFF